MDSRSNQAPKHTPGPWIVDTDYIIAHCQFDADGYAHGHIAQVTETFYGDYHADLQLIAAAPEMLEALVSLVFHKENNETEWLGIDDMQAYMKAKAVIAKAEGRTP